MQGILYQIVVFKRADDDFYQVAARLTNQNEIAHSEASTG
jgi:hypothetical protein